LRPDKVNFFQEEAVETTKQKEKKGGKSLSPRNRKACRSISTALLQSVTKIGTQSTMKGNKKTLIKSHTTVRRLMHDFFPYIIIGTKAINETKYFSMKQYNDRKCGPYYK
jgi:hypothetical protein